MMAQHPHVEKVLTSHPGAELVKQTPKRQKTKQRRPHRNALKYSNEINNVEK